MPRPDHRHKVLFIEDDLSTLEAFTDTLRDSYHVLAATSVKDALNAVESNPDISAVVTDLVLPAGVAEPPEHSVGIRLIEELRSKLPRVPIIVFSAYFHDRYRELSKLGASALVSKLETTPNDLFDEIREAIEKAERARAQEAEQSELLTSIRHVLIQEVEKYAPVKERTIHIPGEGHFELIKPLVGFKRDIERQLARFPYKENVFLMMKFRSSNAELGDFIIESLRNNGLRGRRADHDDWNLTRNVYNPIAVLYCCKYGIALFDEPEPHQAFSANVAYELGMMHYQNKDCLILKHATLPQVPFDLIKDLYVEYDKDLSVRRMITSWIRQVTANL